MSASPDHDRSAAVGPGWSEDQPTVNPNGEPAVDPDEIERLLTLFRDEQANDEHETDLDFDPLRKHT